MISLSLPDKSETVVYKLKHLILKSIRKYDIAMYKLGRGYGIIFKIVIPFLCMMIPIDQMFGLVFGAKNIFFFFPFVEDIFAIWGNPLFFGLFTLEIIAVAMVLFLVLLIVFPKTASVVEFILIPCYIVFLYVILGWQFNILGWISLIGVLVLLVFKLLKALSVFLRKKYNIKPTVDVTGKSYDSSYGYYY